MTDYTKLERLQHLIRVIRRNYPEYPTTFGPCSEEGCDKDARGSGMCPYCAEAELAALTELPSVAFEFHFCERSNCSLIGQMQGAIKDDG